MSKHIKTIIIVVVAFVLLVGAFLLFSNAPSTDSAVSANGAPASSAEVTFLNLSSQLDSVSFDTTVLDDPRFAALVDIHTAILPETTGRSDPFAPIGSGG